MGLETIIVFISYICFCSLFLGFGVGIGNWFTDFDLKNKYKFGYLDLFKDVLNSKKLRTTSKYIICLIVFVPYTIFMLTWFIVSLRIIPYLLYNDRKFL